MIQHSRRPASASILESVDWYIVVTPKGRLHPLRKDLKAVMKMDANGGNTMWINLGKYA